MPTRYRIDQAKDRAIFVALDGTVIRECKMCGGIFYSRRMDAQTCSVKCRSAFSRSSKGALARLKRLAKAGEEKAEQKERIERKRRMQVWKPAKAIDIPSVARPALKAPEPRSFRPKRA
jgi:hypothetical protein